jgi:hypothetical protein
MISNTTFEKACEQYGVSAEYHCTADNRYQLIIGIIHADDYHHYWSAEIGYLVGRYYPTSTFKKLIYLSDHSSYKMLFDLGTVFDMINSADNIDTNEARFEAGFFYAPYLPLSIKK